MHTSIQCVSYKTRANLVNLIHCFLDKFAAESYQQFLPHLNVCTTLPLKLEMLIKDVLPLSCYRKKLQNLSDLNSKFAIFESS